MSTKLFAVFGDNIPVLDLRETNELAALREVRARARGTLGISLPCSFNLNGQDDDSFTYLIGQFRLTADNEVVIS